MIFHDPPEAIGASDPVTSKLEPHNIVVVSTKVLSTWMRTNFRQTDATKTYVDWATKNGFAVIDVNIPSHITNEGVRTYTLM